MKTLIMTSVMALSMATFASEGTQAVQPGAKVGQEAVTQVSHKEAKEICKKEGKKGKEYKECIAEKTMKK